MEMNLSLGPLLYYWSREDTLAFYDEAASWPVARVYLGASIDGAPVLVLSITNRTVRAGADVVLSAAVYSTVPYSMQWRFDGNPVPGATNFTLTNMNVQISRAGVYSLVMSNAFGVSEGLVANLTVLPPSAVPGATDPGFYSGRGPDQTVAAVALQSNGSVLVSGSFTRVDGRTNVALTRLTSTGAHDPSFQAPSSGAFQVYALAVNANDDFFIGGSFSGLPGGYERYNVARMLADGVVDPVFQ